MHELPLRHINRNNALPARDARRFEAPTLEAKSPELEAAHSVDFEDEPSMDRLGRYNAKPYGPGYLKLVGHQKSDHLLDNPEARENWAYRNPAEAVIRLSSKDL